MRFNAFIFILLLISTLLHANEESRSLDYLNTLRQKSGLIPLKENKLLRKAAASHANYLISHQKLGHLEQAGKVGYTGNTPSQRVIHYGYASKDVMENIAVNTKDGTSAVNDLLAAIYHRFVFLSFDKDEIGIGRASTNHSKHFKDAYVYNLGSSTLNALCQKSFLPLKNMVYMQHVCSEPQALIPQSLYEKNQKKIRSQNAKAVLHPYPGQIEVRPVFYNEEPDPLPDYEVSGYPISVQFNDSYYSDIRLKSFRLFDDKNKEVMLSKVLTHENDPHKHLKKTQFALMPLKRLEYATTYRVEFEAEVAGVYFHRSWKFATQHFKEKFYRITEPTTRVTALPGSTLILYFVPRSSKDVLKRFRATHGLQVSFIDYNTLKVILPEKLQKPMKLDVGSSIVFFE